MEVDISDRLWLYGCKIIRNSFYDIKRREKTWHKYHISLETMESASLDEILAHRAKAFEKPYDVVLHLWGEEVEFTKEALVKALWQLGFQSSSIVILHYCLKKTDAEICSMMKLKTRNVVQYKREKAIKKLREILKDWEEEEYELL